MSRRSAVEQHRHSLEEIRGIMNSMKTLAFMETRKLARFLPAQAAVVTSIETMAMDLQRFHPEVFPDSDRSPAVVLMVGTERGFCGDFNRLLLEQLAARFMQDSLSEVRLLLIGRRLHTLLEEDKRVLASIDGASVAEEVPLVLQRLIDAIMQSQAAQESLNLFVMYHGEEQLVVNQLLPPFQGKAVTPSVEKSPPLLNMQLSVFVQDLTDQYLYAVLHQILYTSLMMENRQRVAHLDGAVRHLDERSAEFSRQSNVLRQEEIIEEIEVILLSAASLDDEKDGKIAHH